MIGAQLVEQKEYAGRRKEAEDGKIKKLWKESLIIYQKITIHKSSIQLVILSQCAF